MSELKHIAVIMDGNRRFAKEKFLMPGKGHEKGLEVMEQMIFDWVNHTSIKELTFYGLSLQNFKRAENEVNFLLGLFSKIINDFLNRKAGKLNQENIRIKFIGRREIFSEKIQEMMKELEETTKKNVNLTVNLAVAYGGREEILDAVNKAITFRRTDEFTMEEFSQSLDLQSEPDMVIRTGKDNTRTSNFLIWQTWYSEWFFVDKLWPEFSKEDLTTCIQLFLKVKRNFGK